MRDAIADLVRDGDCVAIEGFTHLISFAAGHEIIRQRKRDLTLARLTPDLIYDQMVAAGVARKLVFSWLGNPGVGGLGAIRRRIEGAIPDEPLEVEEYSHFGMVGRYTAGAMNLPFFPLRSYFETDLPVANPLIRPIDVAVRRRDHLRGAAAAAGRHDRPRPARVGRRRHPGLGPARLPEGGGVRGRSGHRRGRGAGRRGGHPRRPEPDDHPGPDRRRGGRRAVGRAPVIRPGRLRPRQPVLPRLGRDHPRRGDHPGVAPRVGLRPRRPSRVRGEAGRGAGRLAPARRRRRRARSTTGRTADGRADDPGRRAVPVGNRWRSGPDRGQCRGDDRGLARALPPRPPAGHGGVVRAAAHRAGRTRPATPAPSTRSSIPIAQRLLRAATHASGSAARPRART